MKQFVLAVSTAVALTCLAACNQSQADAPTSKAAKDAAGADTIASQLATDSKFAAAAKLSGLDGTLAGPGPYTVLVPNDAAFAALPASALDKLMSDAGRSDLTAVMTYHIIPGTVLTSDIAKAIDQGKGSTTLPTMGGGTITAKKDGDAIVLTDSSGTAARIVEADGKRSNGVVQHIDAVLKPS